MIESRRNELLFELLPIAIRTTRSFNVPGYEFEDLNSEATMVLIGLLDSEKEHQGEELNAAYLTTTVKHHILELKRRACFLDLTSLDEPLGGEGGDMLLADIIAAPKSESPEDVLIASELMAHVLAELNKLPELEHDVVALRVGFDLDNEDDEEPRTFRAIAERFQISNDKAERIYHRSIAMLSEAIQ